MHNNLLLMEHNALYFLAYVHQTLFIIFWQFLFLHVSWPGACDRWWQQKVGEKWTQESGNAAVIQERGRMKNQLKVMSFWKIICLVMFVFKHRIAYNVLTQPCILYNIKCLQGLVASVLSETYLPSFLPSLLVSDDLSTIFNVIMLLMNITNMFCWICCMHLIC